MNQKLMMISAAILIMTISFTTISGARSSTGNDSYATGSLMDSVNQTTNELGHNASLVLNNASKEVGSTLNELGQNMSNVGSEILNETEQTAKKVGIGAADVLSNISSEIKEGINGK